MDTPIISAAILREALIAADLYDERNPSTSIRDLLTDILFLIDAEQDEGNWIDSFDRLVERAKDQYQNERPDA